MKTVLEVLTLSTKHLQQKNISNARRDAEELIASALEMPRLDLYMQFDRPVTDKELDDCRSKLLRRSNREPVDYICGSLDFYHCKIQVTPDVLIPRQETEILVDLIVKQLESVDLSGKILFDICCGSGCIGIALKKKFPQLTVILSDISPQALKIAEKNAQANAVQIEILEGDLLAPFAGRKADFIVSNPPYISSSEYETLEPEVKQFEPKTALVSGESGLEIYQRLSRELPGFMTPSGRAWFEMGTCQGSPILKMFSSPPWKTAKVEKDWAGHDRFFFLEIE
jgi:release factor glutamine methyltransferase